MTSPIPPARPPARRRVLDRITGEDGANLATVLRDETFGGVVMLLAAAAALVWANSPLSGSYETFRGAELAIPWLHLDLTVAAWAADLLLAVFFSVAGMELKRELVDGHLREPAKAVVPVVAALGGMAVPAVVFLVTTRLAGGGADVARGWAVPTATDIAFALAVLAVVQSNLPTSLRAFLLTLAVVDDLGAIVIIATVYTTSVEMLALVGAVIALTAFALLQRARVRSWAVYVPLAAATWWLVHEAGVHATVAGMALGLLTRARHDPDETESPAERVGHRLLPWTAGVAVPVFALTAAGVTVDADTITGIASDPLALGIVLGLVVGKPLGITAGAWLAIRLTRAELAPGLRWGDVAAVGVLGGIGFTVSILVSTLAFGDPVVAEGATAAVLTASLVATLLSIGLLLRRNQVHRRLRDDEVAGSRGAP